MMYPWIRNGILLLLLLFLAACSRQPAGEVTPAATSIQAFNSPATAAPTELAAQPPVSSPIPTAGSAPEITAAPEETGAAQLPQTGALPEPDCTSPAVLTPSMTEGPYYTAGAPERTSLLEPGMAGTKLVIRGYVLNQDCQPVPGALLDFWQADAQGVYDNSGYRLRGRQYTDEAGRYILETVVPGLYTGRTAHIHVKVQAPGGAVLTSQLFFPGEAANESDRIFSPELVLDVQEGEQGLLATFNFVVDAD